MEKENKEYETRFEKLKEAALDLYRNYGNFRKLPYHNIKWLEAILKKVETLSGLENLDLSGRDYFATRTGALLQDIGLIKTEKDNPGVYENHEQIGARLIRQILPSFGYTEDEQSYVKGVILLTEEPLIGWKQSLKSIASKIIGDANRGYHFGSSDFPKKSVLLRMELKNFGDKKFSDLEGYSAELDKLTKGFETESAKLLWDKGRKENIGYLEEIIEREKSKTDRRKKPKTESIKSFAIENIK